MTFNYYKKTDDEILNYEVNFDEEQLAKVYLMFFEKYATKKDIVLRSKKEIKICDSEEVLIENYHSKIVDDEYEISYTMYSYPYICRLINNLFDKNKVTSSFEQLLHLTIAYRQKEIENIRRKMDMQVRVLDIMLDNNDYDIDAAIKRINDFSVKIRQLCTINRELASNAQIVLDIFDIKCVKNSNLNTNNKSIAKDKMMIYKKN